MECEECKNGIHKHMNISKDIDIDSLSRREYLALIDCKNIIDENNQCVCHLWKEKYKEDMIE